MNKVKYYYGLLFLLLTLHLLILLCTQFIAWPEMFSYAYLLNKGYLLYKDIINPYPPLLSWVLQFYYKIAGINLLSLKIITYLFILITDIFIYRITVKIANKQVGLIALLLYVLLQISFEGNGLWLDLALTPVLLLAFFVFYKIINNKTEKLTDIFILGVLLSAAFFIKQTVGFYIIFSGIYFIYRFRKDKGFFKYISMYLISLLLPFSIVSLIVMKNGVFNEYLYWVYRYPFQHLQSSGFQLLPTAKQSFILILLIAFPFLFIWQNRKQLLVVIIGIWFILSLSFCIPRFSYFHLQPCLPFIAILLGYLFKKIQDFNKKRLIFGYVIIIFGVFGYFVQKNLLKEPRFYDHKTIEISHDINMVVNNKETIYFYNLSSEYFVIGNLLPVKPWADTFPWYLESSNMQDKIVLSLEENKTPFIIKKEFSKEGMFIPGSYLPQKIDNYINNNYRLRGKITNDIWLLERI